MNEAFGREHYGFFDFFRERFPALRSGHALSLCCGDGAFERALIAHDVFHSICGMDVSGLRIEAARAASESLSDRIHFEQQDLNGGDFGEDRFDAVFAKAALHHIENLEQVFAGLHRALRPGGLLLTIDFFGPTRFQWTDLQMRWSNHILQTMIPTSLRLRANGSIYDAVERPTVEDMIAMDPSEAVRSSEIERVLSSFFDPLVDIPLGGTLLNLVFYGEVVNHFVAGHPEHDAIIERAFSLERELIQQGQLPSDFRLLVCQRR